MKISIKKFKSDIKEKRNSILLINEIENIDKWY